MKKYSLLLLLLFFTCSAYSDEGMDTAKTGFYTSAEAIAAKYENKNAGDMGFRENFLCAVSLKKLGKKKDAIFHFANACFKYERSDSLKLFPYPVFKFVNGFHFKSDLFDDSVYEIAALFYEYKESEYTIKFTDLVKKENTALYRDAVILKSKALMDLGKFNEASACLKNLALQFTDINSQSLIHIRIASAFEKQNMHKEASDEYFRIIKLNNKSWQSGIAGKRILELRNSNIVLSEKDLFTLAAALYNTSENACVDIFRELLNIGKDNSTEVKKYAVKAFMRYNKYSEADKLISANKSDTDIFDELLKAKADELWSKDKKLPAFRIYSELLKSSNADIAKDSLKRINEYLISRDRDFKNYAEKYIEKYPQDASSDFFLKSLARDELRKNRKKEAAAYMEKALVAYPDSPYSAWHRFWLYKIYSGAGKQAGADNIFKEMVTLNPDSAYTWKLLSRQIYDISDLRNKFNEAVNSLSKQDALFYHMLLFVNDNNFSERNKRIKKLEFIRDIRYISEFENQLFNPKFDAKLVKAFDVFKKYFRTGYTDGIYRELEILAEEEYKNFKNKVLFFYSSKFRNYYISNTALSNLLDEANIKENVTVLPETMLNVLYPKAFEDFTEQASAESKIEKEMIYAVMKAESSFNHNAVSPVGAAGLMQLMPPTAKDLARQLKLKDFDLKDPQTSIRFGAKYLSWLTKLLKGDFEKMMAGYNAGVGNVQKWIKAANNSDFGSDYYIEFIPFAETRNYLLKTNEYYAQYKILYSR